MSKSAVRVEQIGAIRLNLEKHGAFYHPIRVEVRLTNDQFFNLVLNGAVSEPGHTLVQKEFDLISNMVKTRANWIPEMFGCGGVEMYGMKSSFLLGEWLEGFHEFHLTEDNKRRQVVIWKANGRCDYADESFFFPVYRKIAYILALYYDPETFCQIWPWHHAAGDFIVKKDTGGYDVRLITVRGYRNLTEFDPLSSESSYFFWPAMLFFFLNLTLRVRLDRLNGTGKPVLVDEKVIPFIIDGFFEGQAQNFEFSDAEKLRSGFADFFRQFSLEQVMEIMENLLESNPPAPFEADMIGNGFRAHCEKVYAIFQTA